MSIALAERARSETEIRELCARLLRDEGEAADEEMFVRDPELAAEVERRFAACGAMLGRIPDTAPVINIPHELPSVLAAACLAVCKRELQQSGGRGRAKVLVSEIWEQVGRPYGFSEKYVRTAGLGPLEKLKYIKVVKPEQRTSGAYVHAEPRLIFVRVAEVEQRLLEFEQRRSRTDA